MTTLLILIILEMETVIYNYFFEYYHKDINYEGKNHFSCLFLKDSIHI